MATSINLRLNDELEKRLKEKVEEIKKVTPLGAEVNNSTVVRGALIDFFNRLEEEKKDIKTVKFNLKAINDKEKLEKLQKAIEELSEVFSVGYKEEIELGINLFELNNAINYRLFELNKRGE